MSEMLLVLPSRGRPYNIERLYKAALDTGADIDMIVAIDDDDPYLSEYIYNMNKIDGTLAFNFKFVIGPRKKFAATLNKVVIDNYKHYKYIYFAGDDHLPITYKWDEHFRNALEEMGVGVVYGNDLVMGEQIATEWAITSNIIDALGYYIPEGFVHLFVDNYFMELGRGIDKLKYLPDVVVQHLHPCAGTSKEDLTYREANSTENWTNDRIRFENYKQNELENDIRKLRQLLDG